MENKQPCSTTGKGRERDVIFDRLLEDAGLPLPEAEFRFAPPRRWRIDWSWLDPYWVALEVEGGLWIQGRHNRASGFMRDIEKYNELSAKCWRLIRCTPKDLYHHKTIDLIRRTLEF